MRVISGEINPHATRLGCRPHRVGRVTWVTARQTQSGSAFHEISSLKLQMSVSLSEREAIAIA